MVVLVTHSSIKGSYINNNPSYALKSVLYEEQVPFVMISHSLHLGDKSTIFYGIGPKKGNTEFLISPGTKYSWLKYFFDFVITNFTVFFLRIKFRENMVYIGLDPLNSFSGICLKNLSIVNRVVFFSVDYTTQRFSNKFMNRIYQFLDRLCSHSADEVWTVSSRITKTRVDMGVSKDKVFSLYNTPPQEYRKFETNKKNKYHLISLGFLSGQLDYEGFFIALKELLIDYPNVLLKIVGTGNYEGKYKNLVKDLDLENYVVFTGPLEYSDALKEISLSGVGLALYNGTLSYNHYGDSMKCREYLFYGLPILTTNTHSTVEDILEYNAGEVVNMDPKEYVEGLRKIFVNYDSYSRNSYKLGHKYDNARKDNIFRLLEI